MRLISLLASVVLGALFPATPAAARVGGPAGTFASGPLMNQLELTFQGQQPLAGLPGRVLHRYLSDDGVITVDLVVRAGVIEQQVMYLPMEMRRGVQVGFFLQDALDSVVAAQRGLLAFRAAVTNRSATAYRWGEVVVRFTPLQGSLLQVLAAR